jgi:hypothetical protein
MTTLTVNLTSWLIDIVDYLMGVILCRKQFVWR